MDDDDIVLLEPPSTLKRLGLVKPNVLWRAREHIYGLRRSPRARSKLRDDTINGKEVAYDGGSFVAELVSDEEGLFVLRDCCSQEVISIAAVYVDDALVVGQASAVTAFMNFVAATWNTKLSGFISRAGPDELRKGGFSLKRVQELTFIGLQIQFEADGAVKLHQKRWVLSELHQRNWTHLRGSQSLPQVEFVGTEDPESPGYAAALKKAQTELGCLLWVATKSRGDLLSAVSIAASHLHKCPTQVLKIAHGCWRIFGGPWTLVYALKAQSLIHLLKCGATHRLRPRAADHAQAGSFGMVEIEADSYSMERLRGRDSCLGTCNVRSNEDPSTA